jgi:uncharacterized membrane protein YgdD (TMEM256/DUF423 family)
MRLILLLAALCGFLTVGIGAFAAHGLRGLLDGRQLAWLETGVLYQGLHSLALFAVAILAGFRPARLLIGIAAAFVLGIALFSGGLYGLALTGARAFALATPFGGSLLLLGWLLLGVYAWKFTAR